MTIGVIDYGLGNLGSILQSFTRIGIEARLLHHPREINFVDKLILPGVGNFSDAIKKMNLAGWYQALKEDVDFDKKSLLGICLGMQLLATSSSEVNDTNAGVDCHGLDLIPGTVQHLTKMGCVLKVPHIGWNDISISSKDGMMFQGVQSGTDFYFVHSFAFIPDESSIITGVVEYSIPITAAVRKGNIWGVQFHPEKSSKAGLQLLKNFVES